MPIDEDVYAAGQLGLVDVVVIAAQGVRTIINNRPDGEAEDQPAAAEIGAAAEAHGMRYEHVPVVSGRITAEDISNFAELLRQVDTPMLLFCRSGARSTMLYQAARRLSEDR